MRKNMHSSSAWSIGTSKRSTEWRTESEYTPGPGAYNPKILKGKNPPSWRVGTSRRDELHSDRTPGPGAYNSPGKITLSPPRYSMGLKTSVEHFEKTPGPGSYNPTALRSTET